MFGFAQKARNKFKQQNIGIHTYEGVYVCYVNWFIFYLHGLNGYAIPCDQLVNQLNKYTHTHTYMYKYVHIYTFIYLKHM